MATLNDDVDGRGGREPFSFPVESSEEGVRIDHFLAQRLTFYSRSLITSSIKNGAILVDGDVVKASRKLRYGEVVTGYVETAEVPRAVAQKVDFAILHEDPHLLVISKPPGLVVHPASGNPDKTLVNGLMYHCKEIAGVGDDPLRPGIVHRLDKDTSGVMVVAKTGAVHRMLVELFKSRAVDKTYHAIVCGVMNDLEGRVVAPIGRHPVNRKKMAVREIDGRFAASNWHVEETFGGRYSLLRVAIETGRTHQIRVHMASIGHPVAGDSLYGKDDPLFPRQMLHASELRLEHPVTGKMLRLKAEIWPDMAVVLQNLRQEDVDQ